MILKDEERGQGGWEGRIDGYTGAGGAVQAWAEGYFLWDLVVSVVHFDTMGWGSLVHAISALMVTSLGFVSFSRSSICVSFCLTYLKWSQRPERQIS